MISKLLLKLLKRCLADLLFAGCQAIDQYVDSDLVTDELKEASQTEFREKGVGTQAVFPLWAYVLATQVRTSAALWNQCMNR